MTENQTPAAQDSINEIFGTKGTKPAAKTVTTRRCNCGCGEATSSSKTAYKPGHDARHAGQVARAMAAAKINGDATYSPALDTLPSPKLRAKAEAMAKRIVQQVSEKASKAARKPAPKAPKGAADKADQKAADTLAAKVAAEEAAHVEAELSKRAEIEAEIEQAEEPVSGEFTVKMGRWEYPARYTQDGSVERNSKRDGSGTWIEFNGTV